MIFCHRRPRRHGQTPAGPCLADLYGDSYNQAAVEKITRRIRQGRPAHPPLQKRALPSIAITVDLLTTGIDVPAISHLVFMRRVKSRILYEQNDWPRHPPLRRHRQNRVPDLRPVDPVRHAAGRQHHAALVKDPKVHVEQLLDEAQPPHRLHHPGSGPAAATPTTCSISSAKSACACCARRAQGRTKPPLANAEAQLHGAVGRAPAQLHRHLHELGPQQGTAAADFVRRNA